MKQNNIRLIAIFLLSLDFAFYTESLERYRTENFIIVLPHKNQFERNQYPIPFKNRLRCSARFILQGLLSLLRSNFLYIDDTHRAVGVTHGFGWNRKAADFLYGLVQTDNLSDISPLSQILALLIMAADSMLLVYVLCDGKIRTAPLIASASL